MADKPLVTDVKCKTAIGLLIMPGSGTEVRRDVYHDFSAAGVQPCITVDVPAQDKRFSPGSDPIDADEVLLLRWKLKPKEAMRLVEELQQGLKDLARETA